MVVICFPSAPLTGNEQERVATPSMWTVQAPHCAMPQPYLVPVRPTCSRIAHNSRVLGSTSISCVPPLMVRRVIAFSFSRIELIGHQRRARALGERRIDAEHGVEANRHAY